MWDFQQRDKHTAIYILDTFGQLIRMSLAADQANTDLESFSTANHISAADKPYNNAATALPPC
jgi:hypothetical protein